MKRVIALLRSTWWLWLLYVVISLPLIWFVDPVFWITMPIYGVTFVYFAFMRFDEHGNRRD